MQNVPALRYSGTMYIKSVTLGLAHNRYWIMEDVAP